MSASSFIIARADWRVPPTGEDGQGTLLVVYAGWRRWVLGSWKIPTERADAILPRLHQVVDRFGAPCAIMRDLGRAMIEASRDVVAQRKLDIPVLGGHVHFLRDVGKDLLDESHDQLRTLFRRFAVKSSLRALARDLGRQLGPAIGTARTDVERWLAQTTDGPAIPDGDTGLAVVRALAQWVLDYPADGHDEGFPFDLPYLDLWRRGALADLRQLAPASLTTRDSGCVNLGPNVRLRPGCVEAPA